MNPINTVRFSLQPTEFYSVRRLVSLKDLSKQLDLSNANVHEEMVEVYISPSVLSYTLIDNILNLPGRLDNLGFSIDKFQQPCTEVDIYTSKLTGDIAPLMQLHRLNLYESKFEEGRYRGGQRFLFRSESLKEHLNALLSISLPRNLQQNFKTVNNVFRFNHFAEEDGDFHEHYDIPFVDMQNMQISKYTLLVYLTAGESSSKPILSIDNKQQFNRLQAGSCVLFCHRYPHQGRPYASGPKLFLRTELIYAIPRDQVVKFDEEAARAFNRACYLTKESIFSRDLEEHSAKLFREYCQRRLLLKNGINDQCLYTHKRPTVFINDSELSQMQFITDGNDYFFSCQIPLRVCAIVAIHDYLNAGNSNFVIDRYRLDVSKEDPRQIFEAYFGKKYPKVGVFEQNDSQELFNSGHLMVSSKEFNERYQQPDCNRSCTPTGHSYIRTIAEETQRSVHLRKASVQLLDQLYTFNDKDLVVEQDRIYFGVSDSLKNFNFASCYCSSRFPEYFQQYYGDKAGATFRNLPFMRYHRTPNMLVLNLDMFNNGLCLLTGERQPIPFNTQVTKV